MDYEKKYNEALERAKKVKHDVENIGCSMAPDMLEVIFPELAEPEYTEWEKELANALYRGVGVCCMDGMLEVAKEVQGKVLVAAKKELERLHELTPHCEATESELKESEDERIRKEIIHYILYKANGVSEEQEHAWIAYLEKLKEQKHGAIDAKSERVIKAARSVLNNWLDGTDCPDVSGDFAELEYAIRRYDGEEKQKEQKPAVWSVKYIDADRLKDEIKHLKIDVYDEAHQFDLGARSSLTFLESFIDSLRQEQPDNEDIDKVAQELYEHLYELKRRNNVPTNLYDKQEIIDLWKAGIVYGRSHPKQEQPEEVDDSIRL